MPQLYRLVYRTMFSLIVHSKCAIAYYTHCFLLCSCVAQMVFPFSLYLTHWLPNIMHFMGPSVLIIFAMCRCCTNFRCHVCYVMLCDRFLPRNFLDVEMLSEGEGGIMVNNFKIQFPVFSTHPHLISGLIFLASVMHIQNRSKGTLCSSAGAEVHAS